MSSANRVLLRAKREVSFGVAPGGTYDRIRMTNEDLKAEKETVESQELRADRNTAALIETARRAAGPISYEFSYGSYDGIIEALLFSAGFSTPLADDTSTTMNMDDGDNSINSSAEFDAGVTEGMWIRVSGFATAANNGIFRVGPSPTTSKIILQGGTVVTEGNGPSITVEYESSVTNGTTLYTYAIEREYQDIASTFAQWLGMAWESWELTAAIRQVMGGTFNVVGQKETSPSPTSSDAGGADNETTTDVFNTVGDIKKIIEGNSVVTATGFSFNVVNNIREILNLGSAEASELSEGKFTITGTLSANFQSSAAYDKFLAHTSTSVAMVIEDQAGNAYVIEFPHVKFSAGSRGAPGINQDVIVELPFAGILDATTSAAMRVVRFAA